LLRAKPVVKVRAIVYGKYIDEVIKAIGRLGVAHLVDLRDKLDKLTGLLEAVQPTEELFKCSNIISRINRLAEELGISLNVRKKITRVMSLEEIEEELSRIEKKVEEVSSMIRRLEEERSTLEVSDESREPVELIEKLKLRELSKEIEDKLSNLLSIVQVYKKIEEVKQMLAKTSSTYFIEMWVPKEDVKIITNAINEASKNLAVISIEYNMSHESVPAVFKIPSFLEPFTKLVNSYGLPSAHEINPTLLTAITFPIIFGIMFADIGHAATLALVGVIATIVKRRMRKKEIELTGIVGMVLVAGELLILCGLCGVFWGVLFGEIFGTHEFMGIHLHPIELIRIGKEVKIGGFTPSEDVMTMFHFVLFIGVCHIMLGLILSLVNKIINKEYKEVIPMIFWIWLYDGAAYAFFTYGSSVVFRFDFWLHNPHLLFLPLGLMAVSEAIIRGTEGITHVFMSLIESLSHTVSYGRLLALNLIHANMSKMFLQMTYGGGVALQAVGIIIGTLLALVLEGLIIFVHTLRLHWVEWFSKFYIGGGIEYKPLRIEIEGIAVGR